VGIGADHYMYDVLSLGLSHLLMNSCDYLPPSVANVTDCKPD